MSPLDVATDVSFCTSILFSQLSPWTTLWTQMLGMWMSSSAKVPTSTTSSTYTETQRNELHLYPKRSLDLKIKALIRKPACNDGAVLPRNNLWLPSYDRLTDKHHFFYHSAGQTKKNYLNLYIVYSLKNENAQPFEEHSRLFKWV